MGVNQPNPEPPNRPPLTDLLNRGFGGDELARQQAFELVYAELRRLASSYLRREHKGLPFQTTELVNEACLRLLGSATPLHVEAKAHFFVIAARAMRRVIVDYARARKDQLDIATVRIADGKTGTNLDIIEIDRKLSRLEKIDPQKAVIVELRMFVGATLDEIAEILHLAKITVRREWEAAQTWLCYRLRPDQGIA